jgi:hypothetical protein
LLKINCSKIFPLFLPITKTAKSGAVKQPFLNGWVAGDARAAAILCGFFFVYTQISL